MATLILTDEEKAEPVWSNLSDEALGKMVKRNMALFRASTDKLDQTTHLAAAIWLACNVAQNNAVKQTMRLEGLSEANHDFGDWKVTVEKLSP